MTKILAMIAAILFALQPKAIAFFGDDETTKRPSTKTNATAAPTDGHVLPPTDPAALKDAASEGAKPSPDKDVPTADVTAVDPQSPSEDSDVDEDVAEDADMKKLEDSRDFRKWESPNYSGQKDAIGYLGDQTFQIFWRKVDEWW